MHGKTAEVQEYFIGGQALINHVVAIDTDNGHTDKEMEVVGLVVWPARLPDLQCVRLGEFPLEAQQYPPGKYKCKHLMDKNHVDIIGISLV